MTSRSPVSAGRVLFASMIGTTIEFFDFYIYATAAVLVFPKLFFPAGDPAPRRCNRSRPSRSLFRAPDRIGAVRAFRRSRRPQGHTGRGAADHGTVDRADRPAADLCVIGVWAPLLLALCRFGQGLGLGGEWGGAVLLATRMRRRASAPGMACFRSSVRRSASSVRPPSSC